MRANEALEKSKSGRIKFTGEWYASLDDTGVLYWYNTADEKREPVSFKEINKGNWQPYPEPECGTCDRIELLQEDEGCGIVGSTLVFLLSQPSLHTCDKGGE